MPVSSVTGLMTMVAAVPGPPVVVQESVTVDGVEVKLKP